MTWFLTTACVIAAAIAFWLWWRRRESRRASEFRRAAQALDESDEPLVFVAKNFWFPALGEYGECSEAADKMLLAFADALPDDALAMVSRIDATRAQIASTGTLDERYATALRALFEAVSERGGLDDQLRASITSGALDWRSGAADGDETPDPLGATQRAQVDAWRGELNEGRSEKVLEDINSRIGDEDVQGVYRAALLDCRGRALLALGRPDEAVADFEAAAKLAPGREPGPKLEP